MKLIVQRHTIFVQFSLLLVLLKPSCEAFQQNVFFSATPPRTRTTKAANWLFVSMRPTSSKRKRIYSPSTRDDASRHHHTGSSRILHSPIGHWAKFSDNDDDNDPATQAIHSLADYHHGRWRGRARSFTVTPDVAAGIVQRQESPEYVVSVQAGQDFATREYKLMETLEWGTGLVSARQIQLKHANMDVDSVDGSYSLDVTLPDFPAAIAGTDKLVQFLVEHCIATSDNERVRGFVLYGTDQRLLRIVVSHEKRVRSEDAITGLQSSPPASDTAQLTAQDLVEMQGDIDRLVDRIAGRLRNGDTSSSPSTGVTKKSNNLLEQLMEAAEGKQEAPEDSKSDNQSLSLHPTSLLEVSSGVWLGDAIIREAKQLPSLSMERGRGFGDSKAPEPLIGSFAQWSVGVQKVAWRWMWNFGDEIRQVNEAGRSLGSALDDALSKNLAGSVCVNEGLSRRIAPKERMVFIDWAGDNVGFLIGPVYIQVCYDDEPDHCLV